jgi:hypothetical protein
VAYSPYHTPLLAHISVLTPENDSTQATQELEFHSVGVRPCYVLPSGQDVDATDARQPQQHRQTQHRGDDHRIRVRLAQALVQLLKLRRQAVSTPHAASVRSSTPSEALQGSEEEEEKEHQ